MAGLHFIYYKYRDVLVWSGAPIWVKMNHYSASVPAEYCGRYSVFGRIVRTGIRCITGVYSTKQQIPVKFHLYRSTLWRMATGKSVLTYDREQPCPLVTSVNNSLGDDIPALQVNPSPAKPSLQLHLKPPSVLLHTAWSLHPPLCRAHSSISTPTDGVIISMLSHCLPTVRHTTALLWLISMVNREISPYN